jgi:DNA-binding response OmpR family regulator
MKIRRILLVENEPHLQEMIKVCRSALPGMKVESCPATELAQNHIRTMDYCVIISPLRTPQIDGLAVLREAKRLQPRTPVLLVASLQDWQASRTDLMAGAYDVLLKPVNHDMLCVALQRAAHTHALRWGQHRATSDGCVVIVRGLSNKATVDLVKLLFTPIGKVVWCRFVVDSNAPAFAYVELESSLLASQAVNQLNGRTILGYPLTLSTCTDTLERRVH